ncbi:MAG TPA: hypothetical protein VKU90_14735 [Caulobacteraceae bacterium]|nr:hypothetical protein [Caulobacteraceae bacterium]
MSAHWAKGAAATLAAILAALAQPAGAFGTLNILGQHSEHQRITRWALADAGLGRKTMDALAGVDGRFGAVGAPDDPFRGLLGVKAAHCDGGDYLDTPDYPHPRDAAQARLETCRRWIFDHLDQAVRDAGALATPRREDGAVPSCAFDGRRAGSARCLVLEDLGLAFHAAQDFYAHTNWVDHATPGPIGPANPPGLAQDGRSAWIDPRRNSPFPSGLISGCYDGFPEWLHCGALFGPARAQHRYLNKDEGEIDVAAQTVGPGETPRGRIDDNFQRAVRAAVADTRSKWLYVEDRIRAAYGADANRILCRLTSDTPATC